MITNSVLSFPYSGQSTYTPAPKTESPQQPSIAATDSFQTSERKTGGAGKAWCSTFVSGLGQMLDGRTARGIAFLGGQISLGVIATGLCAASTHLARTKTSQIALFAGAGLTAICTGILHIWNIVDAYKGDQKKSSQNIQ